MRAKSISDLIDSGVFSGKGKDNPCSSRRITQHETPSKLSSIGNPLAPESTRATSSLTAFPDCNHDRQVAAAAMLSLQESHLTDDASIKLDGAIDLTGIARIVRDHADGGAVRCGPCRRSITDSPLRNPDSPLVRRPARRAT
jgi:hypothetical protein